MLCKRTTALTHTTGPSVAVEPGSEIIRGRTNVDDPAVPDRLVLCDPWWLKKKICSVFVELHWLNWIFTSSSVQCDETNKKKILIYFW